MNISNSSKTLSCQQASKWEYIVETTEHVSSE